MVLRELLRQKSRTFLTTAGIAIGIYTLTVLGAMAEHFDRMVGDARAYVRATIKVCTKTDEHGQNPGVSEEHLARLRALPGVLAVEPTLILLLDGFDLESEPLQFLVPKPLVSGVRPALAGRVHRSLRLVDGRWITEGEIDAACVSQKLALRRGLELGGPVVIRHNTYTIAGIYATPNLPFVPDAVIAYERLRADFQRPGVERAAQLLSEHARDLGPALLGQVLSSWTQSAAVREREASRARETGEAETEAGTGSGSGTETEAGTGTESGTEAEAGTEAGSGSEPGSGERPTPADSNQAMLRALFEGFAPGGAPVPAPANGASEPPAVAPSPEVQRLAERFVDDLESRYYLYEIVPEDPDLGPDAMRDLVEQVREAVPDLAVISPDKLADDIEKTLQVFIVITIIVSVVSSVVSSLLIVNTMLMSVMERRREIGIKITVGATPAQIALEFVSEAAILGLVGAALGVLAGCGTVLALDPLIRARFETADSFLLITPRLVVAVSLFGVLLGAVSGFYPALRAARTDPVVTLREL